MTDRYQDGNSPRDSFARPSRKWICGQRDGGPCGTGPDASGGCGAHRDCRPVLENGRWHCVRPPSAGGPCSEGPSPDGACSQPVQTCLPVRTRRAARWRAVLWTVTAVIGVLALLLGGRWGTPVPVPGPLSSTHGTIESCATCHGDAASSPVSWVTAAFTAGSPSDHNAACAACHGAGSHGDRQHMVDPEILQRLTAKAVEQESSAESRNAPAFPAPDFTGGTIACATCHREHRGPDHDLADMTDERCQACHIQRFDVSGKGHPEFTDFPSSQSPSILFSHATHYRKHIPEKFMGAVILPCKMCHKPEEDRRHMNSAPFAKACDACHGPEAMGEDLEASGKGIPFLTIPALDLPALRRAGVAVDGWPADAEGELTPFMTALLSGRSEEREILDRVAGLNLRSLAGASPDDLAAVEKLIKAIERLILDLQAKGADAVDNRLSLGRIRKGNPPSPQALVAGLTPEVVGTFIHAALPHLLPDDRPPDGAKKNGAWKPPGGWFVEGQTLFFRPVGHYDTVSRGWLEYLARFGKKKDPKSLTEVIALYRSKETPGKCTKCHNVRQFEPGEAFRGWGTRSSAGDGMRFTAYSHKPHLHTVPKPPEGKENCLTCHALAEGNDFAKWFENPEKIPDFAPIPQKRCIACHDGNKVSNRCTLCHAYHVRSFGEPDAQRR